MYFYYATYFVLIWGSILIIVEIFCYNFTKNFHYCFNWTRLHLVRLFYRQRYFRMWLYTCLKNRSILCLSSDNTFVVIFYSRVPFFAEKDSYFDWKCWVTSSDKAPAVLNSLFFKNSWYTDIVGTDKLISALTNNKSVG